SMLSPLEQIASSGTQRSMVLAAYSGPTVTDGSLITRINRSLGFPNSATAATWVATSGGIGDGTSKADIPSGMTLSITKPTTAAPWEYPPSTIVVRGQFATVDRTWVLASLMPSMAVGKSVVAG